MIILFTIILFENWNRANIDKHVDDFQLQAEENGGLQLMGAEESSGEPLPPDETTKTEEPTTQDLTTTEAGTTEVTTQELTTEAKTQELTTIEITTEELTTKEVTTEGTTEEPETPTEPTTPTEPPTEFTGMILPKPTRTLSPSASPSQSFIPGAPTPIPPPATDTPTASNTPKQTAPPPQSPTSFNDTRTTLTDPPTPTPHPEPKCDFETKYNVSECKYLATIDDFCQFNLLEKDITEKHQYDLVSAKIEFDYSSVETFNFDYFYFNLTLVGRTGPPKKLYQSHVGELNVQNHLELYNINFFLNSLATIDTLYLFQNSLINSLDYRNSDFSNLSDSSLIVFDETTAIQSRELYNRPLSKGFSYDVVDNFISDVIVSIYSVTFKDTQGKSNTIYTRGLEKEIYLRMHPPKDEVWGKKLLITLEEDYIKNAPSLLTFRIILLDSPKKLFNVQVLFGKNPRGEAFSINLIVEDFTKNESYIEPDWYVNISSNFFEVDGFTFLTYSNGPFHQLGCPTVVPTPQPMDDDAKATGFIIALPFILIVVLACLIVLICYCKRYSNSAKEDSSDDDSYDMDSSTVES